MKNRNYKYTIEPINGYIWTAWDNAKSLHVFTKTTKDGDFICCLWDVDIEDDTVLRYMLRNNISRF